MPTFRVTAPSGKTYRITAPEGATQQQALAIAQRMETQEKPRNRGSGIGFLDRATSAVNETMIGAGEGAYNAAAFITDPIAKGAMRLFGGKDYAEQAMQGAAEQRRGVSDAASRTYVSKPDPVARTAGRIGGAMLAPVPKLAWLGKAAPAAGRAVQGAVGGAGVREVDESAAAPAAIGAAANVVLPPALSAMARTAPAQAAGRFFKKAAAPVMGAVDDAAEAVLSRASPMVGRPYAPLSAAPPMPVPTRPLAPLGRDAEVRAARLQSLGVDKPTTGQVTRDPRAWNFEQETAKQHGMGDDLALQIRAVEQRLADKGRELAGGAKGAEATGQGVQDALDAKRGEMQKVTGRLYDQVRETRGEEAVGELAGLRGALDDPDFIDNSTFDAMRSDMMKRLQRMTTPKSPFQEISRSGDERILEFTGKDGKAAYIQAKIGSDGRAEMSIDPHSREANRFGPKEVLDAARELRRLYPEIKSVFGLRESGAGPGRTQAIDLSTLSEPAERGVTVKQAEELRRFIGNLGSAADPTVRLVRRRLIDALDDDVVEAVGDDAFKVARASAKARFDEFQKTFAGKIADEGVKPEALTRRILSANVGLKDLRAMRQSLITGTPEQVARGQEAWGSLQKQALEDILTGPGGAITEDGAIQGGKLWRSFKKDAPKLRELLGQEDFRTLRRLAQASRDITTAPPMSAVNYSNTSSAVGNMLAKTEPVKQGLGKLLAKHGLQHAGAFTLGGPPANIALLAGRQISTAVAAQRAETQAAEALMNKIRLAQNPQEMAAAIGAMQQAAESNPVIADIFQRYGLAGYGAARGGAASAIGQ